MRAAVAVANTRSAQELRAAPVYPEPELIIRARYGDDAALSELFDALIPDIYGYSFLATHRQITAERITNSAVKRLPSALRRGPWPSVGALRAHLQSLAQREVVTHSRRQARDQSLQAMHARMRHLVLAATAILAAAYFGLVAL